jgi:dolichol-phosphate mannosyltransferase
MDKLSVIIPSRNEAENLEQCICEILEELNKYKIKHEILVVDDGSTDNTSRLLQDMVLQNPTIQYLRNVEEHGFGRAVRIGLSEFTGDAVAIMMADRSDSPQDLVNYWNRLQEGYECVFGSRFIRGSKVADYPKIKLLVNRLVNRRL